MTYFYSCYQCGKSVTRQEKKRSDKVMCSRGCYSDYYQSRRPLLTCEHCHKQYTQPPSRQKRGERFCSRECYETARTPDFITKKCRVCGKDFSVKSSHADRYTVCSWTCRTAATKYLPCERCGKVFWAEPDLNRRYCSDACRYPPVYITCKTCKTQFRIPPGKVNRKFCCFACYRRYQGETTIEAKVRVALHQTGAFFIQEARVGRRSIDFLLPLQRIALEVDGRYWHRDPARDQRKTVYLEGRGWCVVRVSEEEINTATSLPQLLTERLTIPLLPSVS